MIPGVFDRPGHEAILDRTQSCAQVVYFSRDRGPYCWAHGIHTFSAEADCVSANHGCNKPGTDRLGLCRLHAAEIIG